MNAFTEENGEEGFDPVDPNDKMLVAIAEGSNFQCTTFPSGWKSPDYALIAKNGRLVKVDNP